MGAGYGLLARRTGWQGVGSGMAFGLAAWCGSYLGWLPAFNMRASAANETARRNAMMIVAHLVWGGAMGYLHKAQQTFEK
jgi:putative membrane protein